ncbi:Crp/Fnr family transcriptional regulator [Undibacterium sp. SXout7W]|uniref:Crp/Fnr family transcriptional regulator n=1 Tax=Undibacterium sp. SXout7W TaxID=3413049 RepID=UPI003BF15A8F
MNRLPSPMQNYLLDALATPELNRLLPDLELITVSAGDIIYEAGVLQKFVYFPTTSVITLLYMMEDGTSAEIAAIGNEGIVGISLFMGGATTPNFAIVQRGGYAYRLKGRLLKMEFDRAGPVLRLLLRYTQALITQMTQIAICNRHHSVEQQLCRWLLQNFDRESSNSLVMTQQLIANTLGIRRERITEAASALQKAGLISYSRGSIEITDRSGLEKKVCECYQLIKNEFDQLKKVFPNNSTPEMKSSI